MATTTETKIIEIRVPIGEGIKQIKLLTDEITKLSVGQAALKKGSEAEKIQYEKNAIAIKEYSRQKRVLQREVQTEIKATQSAMGAYDKLQLAYTKAAAKAKDLAVQHGVNSKASINASAKANSLNDKLKAVDATMGVHIRTVGDYKNQMSAAIKETISLKNTEALLEAQQKSLIKAGKENTKAYKDLSDQIVSNKQKLSESIKEVKKTNTELKGLGVTSTKTVSELKSLGLTTKEANDYLKKMDLSAKNTVKELKSLGLSSSQIKTELKSLGISTSSLDNQFSQFRESLKRTARQFLAFAGITAIISGIGTAFKNALNIITEFDQQMANVSAITMATKEEMKKLRDIAVQLGGSTKFTASEVAGLEVELGKLGFTTQQIIDATGGITMAAAATGEGLQKTAEIVGSVTMAFGLSAGESQRVADVMAQSFNSTALGLDNFSESIKYVAPVAKQVGVSVEETAALLGVLANSGIKGSQAGTALRRIFSELTKDGGTLQQKLDQLAKSGLNLAGAQDEVGAYAKTALLVLKDQNELIPELTKNFENSAGAAEVAAAKMLDTIKGQSTILKSTWEGFILSIENGTGKFATNLKYMLSQTTEFVRGLQRLLMSESEINKMDAQNQAQNRLKDFEKRAQLQQDYNKYLNEEIVAEKNVYQVKQDKAKQLISENAQTLKWIEDTEKYLATSRDVNFERTKNLASAKIEFESKQKEIASLNSSVNKHIEYVNVLGNLRRAKNDQTTLEIKNKETLDKNNAIIGDATELTKEQKKELDKLNKSKQEEYEMNAKLMNQFEKMKADSKAQIQSLGSLNAKPFNDKIEKTDPIQKSKDVRAQMLQDSIDAYDNELEVNQNNADETLRVTKLQLSDRMNLELSAVQEGSQAEFNIREKYRLLNIDADKQATQSKIQGIMDWANAAADILQGSFAFSDALAENELALWSEQNKGKANFDEEYAKKKAKIDHDAAVRNKAMQVVNSLINGAAGVVARLGVGDIPGAIASGIAAALQTAAIIATPIPSETSTGSSTGSVASTPDLTSKMASPLSGSVTEIQSTGGSNAITSGATVTGVQSAFDYDEFAKAVSKLPAPELSLVELKEKQKQVDFLDVVSTYKS